MGTGEEARLFTVRIRSGTEDGVLEHRGQVRDVASGAFQSFRSWAELTAFLAEQLGETPSERQG